MTKTIVSALVVLIVLAMGLYFGKTYPQMIPPWESESSTVENTAPARINTVVAQGRLVPFSGMYNIMAPPGQTVSEYKVEEGDAVKRGQELVDLAGHALLRQQKVLADARIKDSGVEIDKAIQLAKLNVRAAEVAVKEAEFKRDQVAANEDQSINQSKLQSARQKLQRAQALTTDPDTRYLISKSDLADKQIELDSAKADLAKAKEQIAQGKSAAEFAVDAATETLTDARNALADAEAAKKETPESLQAASKLAQTQLESSQITSPIDGTVLKIFVKRGESVVATPLMQIGNLKKMECVAEVSDRMVGRVKVGDDVTISSPAFEGDFNGKVTKVGTIVGNGTLPNPNPLALVDKKTIDVRILIENADQVEVAKKFLNLQVNVEFKTGE